MDKDGYVSLWVGRCNNYDVLNNYLSTVYIDEDLRDGNVLEHFTDDLEVLFNGFSYYDTFFDEAKTLHKQFSKCNAAVALYDFKYCGDILESKHKDISLYFLGYVKYKKH